MGFAYQTTNATQVKFAIRVCAFMKMVAFVQQTHNAKDHYALLTLLTQQLPSIVPAKLIHLAPQTLHVSQVYALHQIHIHKLWNANL